MKRITLMALAFVVIMSGLVIASAQAAVSGVSGDVMEIPTPPSAMAGLMESDTKIKAFLEKEGVKLPFHLTMDITEPGVYTTFAGLTPRTLAAGSPVNSYMLHFDPIGTPAGPVTVDGSITFGERILGVFVMGASLDATDGLLGAPGTTYSTGMPDRGLELLPEDMISVEPDNHTIIVHLVDGPGIDQIRVVTVSDKVFTIEKQVMYGTDDAYHAPTGWPHYGDSDSRVYAGRTGPNLMYGGFRWRDLNIPNGAIIISAHVEMSQRNWGHQFETSLTFEDSASPSTFSYFNTPYDRLGDSTSFSTDWTWDKQTPDSWIPTPSLTVGVQELVDAYQGIDSIVLLEDPTGVEPNTWHAWHSYEGSPAKAAKIIIEYVAVPRFIVETSVMSSTDDAYHAPTGWPNYSDSDASVYIGSSGAHVMYAGFRFTDVNVLPDAHVIEAYVELTQRNWGHEFATILTLEDSAAPATFSAASTPFDRLASTTAFSKAWTWDRMTPNSVHMTPSLVAGVQELVDSHGGISDMVLLEDPTGVIPGTWHAWNAYDADPAKAAKLFVLYEVAP